MLEERLLIGADFHDEGWIFHRPDGSRLRPDATSYAFVRRVERYRLPRLTLHGLRHTWATLALEQGIHPRVVQERLGHSTIAITLGTYSHVSPTLHAEAAQLIADLVFEITRSRERTTGATGPPSAPAGRARPGRQHRRGPWGPTTLAKLAQHAQRTHDAYVLDGQTLWGVSVFCALDDIGPSSLTALLRRFASYRAVHLARAGQLRHEGFELLPSFRRPHFTVKAAREILTS